MRKTGSLALAIAFGLTVGTVSLAAPDGKALYSSKCAMCHSADGTAKKTAAPSKDLQSADFKATATVESVTDVIIKGKEKMKPVKVTPEEAKAIAEYVLTLGAPAK
jgi:mono/diheme cytochrome c family protein